MASRTRARSFALQQLYAGDVQIEALATALSVLMRANTVSEEKELSRIEKKFSLFCSEHSTKECQAEKKRLIYQEFGKVLDFSLYSLLQTQFELPESWIIEQQIEDPEQLKLFLDYVEQGLEPVEAIQIARNTKHQQEFAVFQKKCLERLGEDIESYTPSLIAHWLFQEPKFQEMCSLEIDLDLLVEVLCFLQKGSLTPLATYELLHAIRVEYDPNNQRQPKRSVEELGKKKNLLGLSNSIHPLKHESDGVLVVDWKPAEPEEIEYATTLMKGVYNHLEIIDDHISKASNAWRIERMSIIDRNVLRMACFELCYKKDIPSRVVINEAIKLTKMFSGSSHQQKTTSKQSKGYSDGVKFVNGVLDRIARELGRKDLSPKHR